MMLVIRLRQRRRNLNQSFSGFGCETATFELSAEAVTDLSLVWGAGLVKRHSSDTHSPADKVARYSSLAMLADAIVTEPEDSVDMRATLLRVDMSAKLVVRSCSRLIRPDRLECVQRISSSRSYCLPAFSDRLFRMDRDEARRGVTMSSHCRSGMMGSPESCVEA